MSFGAVDLVVIAILGVITWIIWDYLDGRHQPPGPPRLPFLGSMISAALADPNPYVGVYKLCKRYGKHGVTRIQMGFFNAVFINSMEAMKNLYTREECLSRVAGEEGKARNMNQNLGILLSEGRPWMEIRRFILKTLKNLGLSKRSVMESTICSEVNLALEEIKEKAKSSQEADGSIRITQEFFALTTVNILLWLVTGERSDRRDKSSKVNQFLRVGKKFLETFSVISGLYNYWPFLIRVAPTLSGFTLAKELSKEMQDVARGVFKDAKASGRYKTSQNCFVDEFLAKMEQEEEMGGQDERIFTEDQFVITIMDLIQAGSDTTSGNIAFGILLLASFPSVQEKFLEEITKVVGPDRNTVPCLDDRDKMPYTQAVILETLRYARVLIFLPRRVMKDFWYQGYLFKKGTTLMLPAHNMGMDKDVWKDPDNYRPERFLNPDGSLNKGFVDETILPFGIGKKSCVGEGLARDTLFLMLTTLVKKLDISLPQERPKPSLVPVMGFSATPTPFHVVIKDRA